MRGRGCAALASVAFLQPQEQRIGGGHRVLADGELEGLTSTRDTDLPDTLVPAFQRATECSVRTVAVGSGQAIDLGERGQADALLVHSPDAEEAFMEAGHGLSRHAVVHDDFVLVGPPADPGRTAHAGGILAALRAIARRHASFASRADDSGTSTKDLKRPKPAITAASSGSRASSHGRTTSWRRLAPSARSCSGSSGGSAWIAASVIPAISGTAIRTWARSCRAPCG